MKTSRIGIHILSVLLLLLWGGVMIYFYASGRLDKGVYLSKTGIFIPAVLYAGIGLIVVGLFNLATMGSKDADCCGHDHAHDDHDHKHDASCGHDHHEHEHQHDHADCGHDHHHHDHDHGHSPENEAAGHVHGVLEESGLVGRLTAIFILIVPVTYAAIKSPDQYSANAVINKGVYSNDYSDAGKGQGNFKTEKSQAAKVAAAAAKKDNAKPVPAAETPVVPAAADTTPAPAGAAETKSYGKFTLADLKSQVPQSKEGNFMLEVPEIYYTAGDKEVQGVLTGQPVEAIAQVMPEKVNNEDGRRLRIFRLMIQCCAADARPYSIPVEFEKKAPEIKEMSWVKIVGKMTYKQENGQTVPVVEVTSMTEAAEPDSKMVY